MRRKINRFNWIAAIWIVCGLLDIIILYLVEYRTIIRKPDDQYRWMYEFVISFSFIAAIGSMISGFMLSTRIWKRLAIPGTCILAWGFVHSLIAVSYTSYYTIKIPRIEIACVTIVTLVGMAFIIASLLAIFSTRTYLYQRQKYWLFS